MKTGKIRMRDRIDSSPPEGMRQSWTEWQIVVGRKIVARCGTKAEALRRAAQLEIRIEGDLAP